MQATLSSMPFVNRFARSEAPLAGLMASFANGVDRDINAVRAAITLGWSNGQTEGRITKLKLVKCQMYGRGKLDLLQARLIAATPWSVTKSASEPYSTPITPQTGRLFHPDPQANPDRRGRRARS